MSDWTAELKYTHGKLLPLFWCRIKQVLVRFLSESDIIVRHSKFQRNLIEQSLGGNGNFKSR